MKKILALLLAAVMTLSIFASCGANEKQAYLNALLKDTGFSGVVFVTKNGHTVCQTAKGVENSETNQPITTDTKFCIGSVSKQFAAAAILLLRQEGKLSVDEDLTRFFPDYRYAKELTIRHLLDMRSGIREFYDVEYIDKDGKKYNNYGTYIMRKYYENPALFKNFNSFTRNVWSSSRIRRLSTPTPTTSCWRVSSRSSRDRATATFCASTSLSRSA